MAQPQRLKSWAGKISAGGVLLILLGLGYLFLTPRFYRASTRIRVIDWIHAKDSENRLNLNVAVAECNVLRSSALQDQVVSNLHLGETWGKYYHKSAPMNATEARDLLQTKTMVRQIPGSSLVEITVTSELAAETGAIANELTRVYLDLREHGHQEALRQNIGSLQKKWETQNQKVQEAQTAMDSLYFEITKARATNKTEYFDSDAYELLMSRRIQLENEFVYQQSQLASFRKMVPEKLRDAVISLDTNNVFSSWNKRFNQAKSDLRKARLDHEPDSREVREATLIVDELNKQIDEMVAGAISVKENDVAALKVKLADLNRRVKNASTNVNEGMSQDSRYNDARQKLALLKDQRDELQRKMDGEESADAIHPTGVTAVVIDSAEVPSKPFTPDVPIALTIMLIGIVITALGLFLFFISTRLRIAARQSGI